MRRSCLRLVDDLHRSPLGLLGEMDAQLRQLERQAATGDPQAEARLARARQRAGEEVRPDKPDAQHNWRWNGKGWYTRPEWNGGRCPPKSEPTDHNSCLPHSAHPHDQAQYHTSKQVGEPDSGEYSQVAATGATDLRHRHVVGPDEPGARGGMILRGPNNPPDEEGNRTMYHWSPVRHRSKNATGVDWDHPNGPQIVDTGSHRHHFWGRENVPSASDRPLPNDPAHLPEFNGVRRGDFRRLQSKLTQHYASKGYHPEYVRKSLRLLKPPAEVGRPLSPAATQRLPGGPMRQRILRRASKARDRQTAAELGDW